MYLDAVQLNSFLPQKAMGTEDISRFKKESRKKIIMGNSYISRQARMHSSPFQSSSKAEGAMTWQLEEAPFCA